MNSENGFNDVDNQVNITFKNCNPSENEMRDYFSKFGTIQHVELMTTTAVVEFSNPSEAINAAKAPVVKLPTGTIFVKKVSMRMANLSKQRRSSEQILSVSEHIAKHRRFSMAVIPANDDGVKDLENGFQELGKLFEESKDAIEQMGTDCKQLTSVMDSLDSLILSCASTCGQLRFETRQNQNLVNEFVRLFSPKKKITD